MSDNKEPKVTECYVNVDEDGSPCVTFMDIYTIPNKDSQRAALIIFREDYDALVKELEELRAESAKWKPFEHGHYRQEGAMVSFVCNYSTEAHDDEEAK